MSSEDLKQFEQRKKDHISLALDASNQCSELNRLDQVHLAHEALPNLDFDEINILSHRLKKEKTKPFLVSSMTAGHENASAINRALLEGCAAMGWAMGVGSQRRELIDAKAAFEWQPLRKDFPDVSLFSNIGIAQLIQSDLCEIQKLIDNLQAEAIIIHLNPLQECLQPEGTPQFKGSWLALENLVNHMNIPVIVKETGCGFGLQALKRLQQIGVDVVDVSGLGGTHWGRIEGRRAPEQDVRKEAAQTFARWGIDTVSSLMKAVSLNPNYSIWGSGGVRNGLDAAKLFALGAECIGFAKPMLEAALNGGESVIKRMNQIEFELQTAMFCTNSEDLSQLRGKAIL